MGLVLDSCVLISAERDRRPVEPREYVCINGGLRIFGEVGIGYRRITEFFFMRNALADLPSGSLRRFNDSQRTMVFLHDYFDTSLHLG